MSPAAQKEAEEIHRKLQELQDEMDRLQDDVKARKLFEYDEDEKEETSSEEEKTDDDEDEEKEGTSESDDEREKNGKGRGAKEKRQDFTEVMDMFRVGEEDGSEYFNDIQKLHAAAVVDELQPGLSRTLGSKASVGSLTSLVKTLKERSN